MEADRPFLGICLGYQLLFAESEESPGVAGLGWREGTVRRFPESVGIIPHMGWNRVEAGAGAGWLGPVFSGAPYFYHVHSFFPDGLDEAEIACMTGYNGLTFASGIRSGNVCAFQFHPEKSQDNGHRLLEAFVQQTAAAVPAGR
ncbi:MAG: imidazole glycerol phosphate synthase subunit HisH [Candidatus Competibacteraceae bacterium]|nr:imidazole glycerol phosphate synthase subunit HisH [Candidatus Competibacteraceae bacterium]